MRITEAFKKSYLMSVPFSDCLPALFVLFLTVVFAYPFVGCVLFVNSFLLSGVALLSCCVVFECVLVFVFFARVYFLRFVFFERPFFDFFIF